MASATDPLPLWKLLAEPTGRDEQEMNFTAATADDATCQDRCRKKQIEARLKAHQDALSKSTSSAYSNAAGQMDNNPPAIYPHLETRAKKVYMEQGTCVCARACVCGEGAHVFSGCPTERIDEIAHENAILLQKMSKIMAGTDRQRQQEQPIKARRGCNATIRAQQQVQAQYTHTHHTHTHMHADTRTCVLT